MGFRGAPRQGQKGGSDQVHRLHPPKTTTAVFSSTVIVDLGQFLDILYLELVYRISAKPNSLYWIMILQMPSSSTYSVQLTPTVDTRYGKLANHD